MTPHDPAPAYSVTYESAAWKQIMALPAAVQLRIFNAVEAMETEPRPKGAKKLKDFADVYRLRVGDYRVLYQVQDAVLLVVVVKVGNRKEVYRER